MKKRFLIFSRPLIYGGKGGKMAYSLPSWPFVLTSWHKVGNLQYSFITPLLIEWLPGLLPGGFSFCLDTVAGAVSLEYYTTCSAPLPIPAAGNESQIFAPCFIATISIITTRPVKSPIPHTRGRTGSYSHRPKSHPGGRVLRYESFEIV